MRERPAESSVSVLDGLSITFCILLEELDKVLTVTNYNLVVQRGHGTRPGLSLTPKRERVRRARPLVHELKMCLTALHPKCTSQTPVPDSPSAAEHFSDLPTNSSWHTTTAAPSSAAMSDSRICWCLCHLLGWLHNRIGCLVSIRVEFDEYLVIRWDPDLPTHRYAHGRCPPAMLLPTSDAPLTHGIHLNAPILFAFPQLR